MRFFVVFIALVCGVALVKAGDNGCSASGEGQDCNSPSRVCDCLTWNQAIGGLWGVTKTYTPLVTRFKNRVLEELATADEAQTSVLLGQSLFAVNLNQGFRPTRSPTCVCNALIKATVERSACHGGDAALDSAVVEFGGLGEEGAQYTIAIGMRNAGCDFVQPENPITEDCPLDPTFTTFVQNTSRLSQPMKDILVQMSQSDCAGDRTLAVAAVAAATDSSTQIFVKSDALLKLVQLKGCKKRIPKRCCAAREAELRRRNALVEAAGRVKIQNIVANN